MSYSSLRQIRIAFLVLAAVAMAIPAAAQDLYTVTPCRVYDSRGLGGPLDQGTIYTVTIAGSCGVPAEAKAVALNVTVVGAAGAGELALFPTGTTPPFVGMLPFKAGRDQAIIQMVALGTGPDNGKLSFRATIPPPPADAKYHLVIDVAGYYLNVPPTLTAGATLSYTEDDPPTAIDTTITVADPDDPTLQSATVQITSNYVNGEDVLSFVDTPNITGVFTAATGTLALTGPDTLANWQTALRNVLYENTSDSPSTLARTVTWIADDGFDESTPVTSTINVTAHNDAPAGADNTVSTSENTDYVFTTADFGFTDPLDSPPNALLAVRITTLPGAGSLTLSGGAVSAGQSIPVADITAGNLKFTPAPNASGSPYTTFTFQVQDDGGTANGGVDLDPTPNTMTVNVTGVNNAPEGTDNAVAAFEDTQYTFTAANFGFTDPNDTPANNFASVVITTLPGAGSLTLSGGAVVAGQEVTVADINAGNLKFLAAANASGSPYTTFTFQVRDDGGTAGGGVDLDPTPNTMTINVAAVNDEPAGTNNTVSTAEDTQYTFTAADFGFTDPNDTPANALQAVKITTLPALGSLTLSGGGFAAGTDISVADINAGNLKFTPAANGSGSPYTTFTFQVRDDGGTAGGGVDLDSTPNTMTIDVTANNDAPAGTNNTVSTAEDTQYTFTAADFGFTDPNDTPANNFASVVITTLPALGSLTLSGGGVVAGQEITVADINAGNLKFTPAANGSGSPYTTFTFQVRDDGGTAGGGVDLDPTPNTMTINVTGVNDAPAGTNGTVAAFEDTQYTFTATDFGFTDPNDTPANALASVVITTLPGAGSLTLSGGGVVAGQEIAVADINAGNLKFLAAANAAGSPYTTFTFQLRDDGGTAGGGVDLDPTPNTMTINVTAVNDAPAGTDNTVTTPEDIQYTFTAADFGFTDPNDSPANNFASVVITTLPAAGSLTLSGSGFAAGTEISVANITAGNLKFLGASNAFGSPYASFTFQVRDDGGTVGGGVNLDASPNTMTINVTPVNDPPVADLDVFDYLGNTELRVDRGTVATPHVLETTPSTFGVVDGDSDPVEGDAISVTAITVGSCTDNSLPLDCTDPAVGTVHMQSNGQFTFEPTPGDTGAALVAGDCPAGAVDKETFQYTLTDNGTPAAASTTGTVRVCRFERIWYVDPNVGGGGNGSSALPYNNLDSLDGVGGALDSDVTGDHIFVHDGSLTLSAALEMEANQHLVGQGTGLSFPLSLNGNPSPTVLVAAGAKPQLTFAGDAVKVGLAIPVRIVGLSLASTSGNAIDLTSTGLLSGSATLTIDNNEIRNATAEGVDINLNAGTNGTLAVAFTNNIWDLTGTHTGNSFDARTASATANLRVNFSNNTNVLTTSAGAAGVFLDGSGGGTLTVTGFANNSVHQNSAGSGIVVGNAIFDSNTGTAGFQQVSGGTIVIGASGNGVGASGMSLTNVQGNLFYTDLDIFADNGVGLRVSGTGGGMTFGTSAGVAMVEATNGPAVDVTSVALTLPLTSLKSTNSSTTGVALNSITGTFSAGSASAISGSTGTGFLVGSSNATVSYAGTVTTTAGKGVDLTSNTGSTISFTGTLSLSSGGNTAFNATGGGTVTATSTASTLTSSTGTALNVTSTTIGASGLKFQSISAGTPGSGPANGIVLNNTGSSGGLTVSGTGSAGSGGTIRRAGTGVSLTSTRDVSLSHMQMNDFTDFAIRGSSVVNFTMNNTVINGTSGDNASADEGSVRFTELTGSASISNCNISGAVETNVRVVNTSGTLNRLTIDGTTIGANHATTGDDGLFVQAAGSSVVNVTVQNSFFTSARGDLVNTDVPTGGGTLDLIFTGNALSNNHSGIVSGGGGTTFSAVGGTFTYDILNNTFRDANGAALAVSGGNNGVNTSGTIEGNTIGVAGAGNENSGSIAGSAIAWVFAAGGTHTAKIHNNNVRGYNNHGILIQAGDQMGNPTNANVTVTQNTVQNPGTINTDFNAIHLNHGVVGTDNFTSCVDIGGAGVLKNVVSGGGKGAVSPNNNDIRLRQRQATTVRLPGYGGANNDNAAVQAYLTGRNTLTTVNASNTVPTGGGYIGGAACAQP